MNIQKKANRLIKETGRMKRWHKVVTALACVVVFCTTYVLIMPAITMERDTFCGHTAHTHSDSCYSQVLTCGLEETQGHVHKETCYETEQVLICGLEEDENHTHTDKCYEASQKLICGMEEGEGAHTHTDACYEQQLTCGLEEHTHILACYSNPEADTESAADWEASMASVELTENLRANVAAIAQSQIDYKESTKNYEVMEDGETIKGYTRYGAWYGDSYADWDGMFVDFCLHYAGVSSDDMPAQDDCADWIEFLDKHNLYVSIDSYDPQIGDLVFIDDEPNDDESPVRLALISEVKYDRDNTLISIKTVEGNPEIGKVEKKTYQTGDKHLFAYGILNIENNTEAETETTETASETEKEQDDTVIGTLKVEGKDYKITVDYTSAAGFPEDVELIVTEITKKKELNNYIEQSENLLDLDLSQKQTDARFFDITFKDSEGNEITPEAGVKVNINVSQEENPANISDVQVVHFGEEAETVDCTKEEGDDLNVSFDAESFSVYGVVYTVDFHYEVNGKMYEFSIPGGGFVSLEHIVEVLGIATGDANSINGAENGTEIENDFVREVPGVDESGENGTAYEEAIKLNEVEVSEATKKFVADVENVEFSSPELVWVGNVDKPTTVGGLKESNGLELEYSADLTEEQIAEINTQTVEVGDWALISLKAFVTEETLTITMNTGETFEIKVTDNTASDPLGLHNESFVITNKAHNRALQLSTNSLAVSAQTPSSDANDIWKFEYNEEAFGGHGGYYIVCVVNGISYYLNAENGQFSATTTKYLPEGEQPGDVKTASLFSISYDSNELRYRISATSDGSGAYLGISDQGITLDNATMDRNLVSLRDPVSGGEEPGTIGTWDIKSDGISLKLFDYSGYLHEPVFVQTGSHWENWFGMWVEVPDGYYIDADTAEIDSKWAPSDHLEYLRNGDGINNQRSLLFSGSGIMDSGEIFNNFTGKRYPNNTGYYSGYARSNIVNSNLGEDKFPVLRSDNIIEGTLDVAEGGSLAYLFNDNEISMNNHSGEYAKKVYAGEDGKGLDGLLRKDEEGYYYYDSEQNYAKLEGNEIILYSDTYTKNDGDNPNADVKTRKIGLFPFTKYDSTKKEEKSPNSDYYNHQFGMTLSADFVYPKDGIVPDTGKNMTFEFSGDDDVWVFIDGVLVLDLGGVHQPISGKIDFAAGKVYITEFDSSGTESTRYVTIASMFAAASQEAGETITFDTSEFSSHKIDFFYLERGGCDSNCKIKFNLLMMKTLTVAKKLNGLTPTEREKYLNDAFLYELGIKHSHDDIPMHQNDEEYWDDPSWREGFSTYSTPDQANTDSSKNHTIKTDSEGNQTAGVPINDGQIYLKANESMTITHLPKTDIFYLAEENELDMQQFETPHAERLYTDMHDQQRHEEEVHLHEDRAAGGNHESDWETRPYALEDTEHLVYTNTLQERNIDVEKLWSDGNDKHTGDTVKFKLKATVDNGSDNGVSYVAFMNEYNSTHETSYSTNINAQWTQTVTNGNAVTTTTTTEDVLDKEYELKAANDWKISFEHLPKKTQDPNGTGQDIIYTVEEVTTADGYTSSVEDIKNVDKVYLDIYKFWPDDNDNHRAEEAETFTVRITDSNNNTIRAVQDSNGEWRYTDQPGEGITDITFGSNTGNRMFDYAARINGLPRYDEIGNDIVYTFEQINDQDATTTGLVMFTRPAEEIEILNAPVPVNITIKKVDEENTTKLLPDAVFQMYRINDSGMEEVFENDAFGIVGEGENAKNTGTFTLPDGSITIAGLEQGRYHLQEIAAPAGYIITNPDTYFTLSYQNGAASLKLTDSQGNPLSGSSGSAALPDGTLGIKVKNTPGPELPATGGPGTHFFTIFGSILTLGAGLLLWRRRRFAA